jgi:integrase
MADRLDGIEVRHARGCTGRRDDATCSCGPSFRAMVWSPRDRSLVRKTFPTLAAARAWRIDSLSALGRGELSTSSTTLRQAAVAWLEGTRSGAIRNRSGDRYKPSAIRGYEEALRLRLLPDLGGAKLSEIRRADIQALIDRLMVAGHGASTIRNTLLPLRVIFRRALVRGEVAVNPTTGLELPAVRGRRDRIASPKEAGQLLAALGTERALWATAVYAGLRRGELQALAWSDVERDRGVIHVRASWDQLAGRVGPKTKAGTRVVPIASVLDVHLAELAAATGGVGLVFGRGPDEPFAPVTVNRRAQRAWKRAGLAPIGLHECRHTFASFMIAAGVNAKALSTYMGHASVTITFDLYGHLMPGNEQQAARLLDAYLLRSTRPVGKTREKDRGSRRSTAASAGSGRARPVASSSGEKPSKRGGSAGFV